MKTSEPIATVSIYLRGDRLQPDRITEALGIQPSKSQKKGDMRPGRKPSIFKIGVWALHAQTNSPAVIDHIDELLIKLGTIQTPLNQIEGVEEAYLDIFIATDDEGETYRTIQFLLVQKYVMELNRLGLAIQFTVM